MPTRGLRCVNPIALKGGGEEGVGPASIDSQNLGHRISQTLICGTNPAYPRSGADPLLSSPFQGYRMHTSRSTARTQLRGQKPSIFNARETAVSRASRKSLVIQVIGFACSVEMCESDSPFRGRNPVWQPCVLLPPDSVRDDLFSYAIALLLSSPFQEEESCVAGACHDGKLGVCELVRLKGDRPGVTGTAE